MALPRWGIVAFLIVSAGIAWAAANNDKVAYAVIVAIFGFTGFYFSEIAKQAVRARHLANQGWAYLLNAEHSLALEGVWGNLRPLAAEWTVARNSLRDSLPISEQPSADFTSVDRQFREKINALLAQPLHVQNLIQHFTKLKQSPGKIDLALRSVEQGREQIKEFRGRLPDHEIALLGPTILLHVISYWTATTLFQQSELALNLYLKNADVAIPEQFMKDVEKLTFYVLKGQVELEMLKPLIASAKQKSLFQLSLALLK